ncbi:MAG: SusC/RagA family TonB-linked outer membrane protein [Tannerellaceae bacterium]|nr:SusC/RagA family TonB-linked outer membrane protein [Tannerellaceae bacterium]
MKKTETFSLKRSFFVQTICIFLIFGPGSLLSAHTEAYVQQTPPEPIRQQESRIAVNGTITDHRGEELIGVNVYVEGTTAGTITNLDGEFSLNNIAPDAVLVVSYVGYIRQAIPLNGRSSLNIVLEEDSETLDEVIVIGYGVQKKVNLSGAVDAISSKALESRPVSNVNTALQGMASNLNIAAGSGRADDAPGINIRGFTSINGGEAFILVDNVPVTSAELARMNPDDIENISVLKDASAAAIYGSRAAYGVILITTKKAKNDKLTINFSGNYAVRTKGLYPEIETDLVTVMEMKNAARTPLSAIFSEAQIEYARKLQQNPNLDRIIIDPENSNAWAYFGETDWQSEAYKNNAGTYTANLNISNRTDKLSYFVSAQYYKQDGMLRYGNDIMKRYNFRGNAGYKLADWWKVGTNISFTNSNYDSPSFLDGYFIWNINRTPINSVPKNPDGTWTQDGAATLGALQEGGRREDRINQTQVSVNTEFDLVKDVWKLNADVNFRRTNFNRDRYVLPVAYRPGPAHPIQYPGRRKQFVCRVAGTGRPVECI